MGKKNRRSGVVWSQDANTGSPLGKDILAWDGVSRTSKRNQKKALIDERKELFLYCASLPEEQLRPITTSLQESWQNFDESERSELNEQLEELFEQLGALRQMKKGGAKQRLIKHLTSTFREEDWLIMEQIKELSQHIS